MGVVKKIKSTPIISLMLFLAITMVGVAFFNIKPKDISVAQSTDCFGVYANMYGSTTTAGTISGVANVSVGVSTTSQIPSKVIILLDGVEIGQARPESASNYSWIMQIPTKLLDAKEYELKAAVKYPDYECTSTPVITQPVDPGAISDFNVVPSTSKLELPVNTSALVSASVIVPGYTTNYAQFALFEWNAEGRGSITDTQNRQTNFFSGPYFGTGKIIIVARYGFRAQDTNILTNVTDTNNISDGDDIYTGDGTSSNSDSDGNVVTTSTTDSDEEFVVAESDIIDDSKQVASQSSSINNDNITKDCAISALGEERFDAINSGISRPNITELNKLKACFARTNYILPSNFAPVAPGDVPKLQLTKEAKINELKNDFTNKNGEQKQIIRLSGKAKPNSNVIIYIFSEPMVLTTEANENGEWVYELDNPLEPGDHTMYAVVDRGDGVYERTDPFQFAIGSAEATADNPAGLSLVLNEQATAKESAVSTYLYVISSAVLLAAIVLVILVAYRHGKRTKENQTEELITAEPSARGTAGITGTEITTGGIQVITPHQEENYVAQNQPVPTQIQNLPNQQQSSLNEQDEKQT